MTDETESETLTLRVDTHSQSHSHVTEWSKLADSCTDGFERAGDLLKLRLRCPTLCNDAQCTKQIIVGTFGIISSENKREKETKT